MNVLIGGLTLIIITANISIVINSSLNGFEVAAGNSKILVSGITALGNCHISQTADRAIAGRKRFYRINTRPGVNGILAAAISHRLIKTAVRAVSHDRNALQSHVISVADS